MVWRMGTVLELKPVLGGCKGRIRCQTPEAGNGLSSWARTVGERDALLADHNDATAHTRHGDEEGRPRVHIVERPRPRPKVFVLLGHLVRLDVARAVGVLQSARKP